MNGARGCCGVTKQAGRQRQCGNENIAVVGIQRNESRYSYKTLVQRGFVERICLLKVLLASAGVEVRFRRAPDGNHGFSAANTNHVVCGRRCCGPQCIGPGTSRPRGAVISDCKIIIKAQLKPSSPYPVRYESLVARKQCLQTLPASERYSPRSAASSLPYSKPTPYLPRIQAAATNHSTRRARSTNARA